MAVKTYGIREIGEIVYVPMYIESVQITSGNNIVYKLNARDPNEERHCFSMPEFDTVMYRNIEDFYTEDQIKELGEKLYKESIVVSNGYDIGTASSKYSKKAIVD